MSQVDIKMEDISSVKKKISFAIPWSEIKEELDAVYRDVGKKAKIKGFRPGKIPRKVIEVHYKDHAQEETLTNIVNKYYWQVLEEKGIMPLSRPEITQEGFKEDIDFTFTASFEIEPDFEPKSYKGMELDKENIQITEADLENRLLQIRQMFATVEDVKDDRAAAKGDFVNIDFTGNFEGESPKELNAENHLLELGSQRFIPGFEEQIIGMKSSETKTIKVTFPDDYQQEKYAGKEVSFTVSVKNIKEKKLPELDENFIKNFDRYNSLDDLKSDVRKSIEEEVKQQSVTNLQNKIMEVLLKENDFEAPLSLVEKQILYMMADTQKRMTQAGMAEKNATELSIKMHDKFKEEATKIVKSFLMLKKIAEKETFTIEEGDIDQHIKDLAEKHGRDYASLKNSYEQEERKDNIRGELIQKKVFDFIEQNANIKTIEKIGMNLEEK